MTTRLIGASVENSVREIFEDLFSQTENEDLPFFRDDRISCEEQIENYKIAIDEIENTRMMIFKARENHAERTKRIFNDFRSVELLRLKRMPIYENLELSRAEKYALLESEDLLPDYEIRKNDFRINDSAIKRWRESMTLGSFDFLFKKPEIHEKSKSTNDEIFRGGKKIQYDRAPLGSIVKKKAKTKPRRSIIKTEQQKIILVARPAFVEFKNFEPRKLYKRTIVIMNVGNSVAKFQLEPRSTSSKFTIVMRSSTGDRENLAPGMRMNIIASFFSDDSDDCEGQIVIRVQHGNDICIVLRGVRDPPILMGTSYRLGRTINENVEKYSSVDICDSCENSSSEVSRRFSRKKSLIISTSETSESNSEEIETTNIYGSSSFAQIECNKCFVGEQIIVVTRLKNIGGDGKFFAMSEIDWNSMSIDDITTDNLMILSCFAMWPVHFVLKRNEEIDLVIYFFPNSHGVQVDKLYIMCDNLAVHPIELIGDGVMYDPNFIEIFGKIQEHNNDDVSSEQPDANCTFDYRMNLGFEMTNGIVRDTITITNASSLEIRYRWYKTLPSVPIGTVERSKNSNDLPLDLLCVRPESGIFLPCASNTFEITVRLTDLSDALYRAVLQLILTDIPLACISTDYDDLLENCTDGQRSCETSMDVRAKEIEVLARCTGNIRLRSFDSGISYEDTDDAESFYKLESLFQ